MRSLSAAMMATLFGALPIAPAKGMVGGMGKRPSVMMEVRTVPPVHNSSFSLTTRSLRNQCHSSRFSALPFSPRLWPSPVCLTLLQRRTAPTRASPLARGRWAASTALKTVSPTTATGGSLYVVLSSEHAWKVALGVERSLPAKVTFICTLKSDPALPSAHPLRSALPSLTATIQLLPPFSKSP